MSKARELLILINEKSGDEFRVFDGIVDAEEYFKENTRSPESVKQYAENGLDILLSDQQAKKIHKLLLKYKKMKDAGDLDSNTMYHEFEKKLK